MESDMEYAVIGLIIGIPLIAWLLYTGVQDVRRLYRERSYGKTFLYVFFRVGLIACLLLSILSLFGVKLLVDVLK